MKNRRHSTARWKIVSSSEEGIAYRFFCEASGAAACTTKPVRADAEERARLLAWEQEGKACFNLCHACGKWVCDTMYNADTFNCVDCTPWEDPPSFCRSCGAKTTAGDLFCRNCGTRLMYGGEKNGESA